MSVMHDDQGFPLIHPAMIAHCAEEDREAATFTHHQLTMLCLYGKAFIADQGLLSHCEQSLSALSQREYYKSPIVSWKHIAARDGAINLYHFSTTLESISKSIGLAKSLHHTADHDKIKAARKLFRDTFPTVEKMRHSVAHAADLHKSKENTKENTVFGEKGGLFISGNLVKGVFSFTHEGKVVSYELSQRTANIVREVAWTLVSAFPDALIDLGR